MGGHPDERFTRADLLLRAGGAAGAVALGAYGIDRLLTAGAASARDTVIRPVPDNGGGFMSFHSRPDMRPPFVTVVKRSDAAGDGLLFLSPNSGTGQRGVMIINDKGELVWFKRTFPKTAMDFRAAMWKGKPVLTWWEGRTTRGLGVGEHVIVDDTYTEVARFPAGHGLASDLHELMLTPHGTALITSWDTRELDLSSLGGGRQAVVGGLIQEIEVPSARVVWEWRSLDHVDVAESKQGIGPQFDYFHINSIDVDSAGNFLVSARNTWAVYKISRRTGQVQWRLGGKKSDFKMGPGTTFAWQHDARHHGGGDRTISIYDDGAAPPVEKQSRAIVLDVDYENRRATLKRAFVHPSGKVLSAAMGNAQLLPNGNMFVGWGTEPWMTEFDHAGRVVWDAKLPHGGENYRAFRLPWVGRPTDAPKLVARSSTAGKRLYVSWNGATEVAQWRLNTGAAENGLAEEATGPKESFETVLVPKPGARFASVTALDAKGRPLKTSNVVRL
jgi:arylsulfotransferase ASST